MLQKFPAFEGVKGPVVVVVMDGYGIPKHDVGSAIDAAHQAFLRYQQCPLKTRSAIISALRETLAPELATLAEESATETGMGNKEDKYLKNKAALENTPGIEDLTTSALTGDGGMVLFEYSPFGVIGAVAPSTNPTETIINNSISMLAAGNSVYFSPHPGAKKVSLKLIARIEEIAYRCSGIRNLVVTVAEPTFEATQQMMSHPLIAVLAITGGPGIVAMGMKSGKKVIGAGAGNPPCIVDETADLVKAAEDIISGAAFDYNLPCIAEKSLIVVASVADRLIQQMQDFDALLLSRQEADTLRAVCLPDGAANKKLVGKSPAALLAAAGLAVPPRPPRLLIAEVEANDPWVTCEQLMPVLPIVRVARPWVKNSQCCAPLSGSGASEPPPGATSITYWLKVSAKPDIGRAIIQSLVLSQPGRVLVTMSEKQPFGITA